MVLSPIERKKPYSIDIPITDSLYRLNTFYVPRIELTTFTNELGLGSTAPAAPTGLTATPGVTSIALSWSASSGATSYKIYRGTSSGTETLLASPGGVGTTYTDSTPTPGTTYYYKVSAVGAGGESSLSSEVSGYVIPGLLAYGDSGLSALYQDSGRTTPASGTQPVGSWSDLSTNGYNENQSTNADRPVLAQNALNGIQAVVGDGVADWLSASGISTTPANGLTLVAVVRPDATGSFPTFISQSTNVVELRLSGSTSNMELADGTGAEVTNASAITTGTWHSAFGILVNATSLQLYQDGASIGTTPTTIALPSTIAVSLFSRGGVDMAQGAMTFWAVYNRAFTTGDAANMYAYLKSRFPSLP